MTGVSTDPSRPSQIGSGTHAVRYGGRSFVNCHRKGILFVCLMLCLGGAYSAYTMPSSVFPQTDFPRVVLLIDNGASRQPAALRRPLHFEKAERSKSPPP